METDTIELRVRRNSPRLVLMLVAVAVVSELLRRVLAGWPDAVILRLVGAVLAGVRTWCFVMAVVLGMYWFAAAGAISLNRRFPNTSRERASLAATAVVLVLVVLFILFVPFCLGSLKEGTYDCITLGRRLQRLVAGV